MLIPADSLDGEKVGGSFPYFIDDAWIFLSDFLQVLDIDLQICVMVQNVGLQFQAFPFLRLGILYDLLKCHIIDVFAFFHFNVNMPPLLLFLSVA